MQAQAPNAFGLPHGEWWSDLAGWFGGLWPGTSDTVKWHQHSGGLSKGSASKRLTHRLFRAGCCGAFGREHWPWSAAPPFDPGVSRAGKRTEGAVLLRVWLIPFGPGVRLPADLYDPVRSAGGCQTPPATQECGVFWGDAQRWPRSWVWTEAWPTCANPFSMAAVEFRPDCSNAGWKPAARRPRGYHVELLEAAVPVQVDGFE